MLLQILLIACLHISVPEHFKTWNAVTWENIYFFYLNKSECCSEVKKLYIYRYKNIHAF